MTPRTLRALAVAALLALAFSFKGQLLVPPAPSPDAEFDTGRALARLERILGDQRPHPVDTPANDSVRARIIAELKALGLKSEVRAVEDCSGMPGSRVISCSLTRNIVAIIGPDRLGKTLLLNAHYDSTPTGPGAADDGIGIATLLEVGQHLRDNPLSRPVILLFNEGEELGLNGASAFVGSYGAAERVGSLINIEARGVSGPAWMFETDDPNGAAIAAFAAATDRPYANSLTADFAKLIPNYTDVAVFKQAARWRTLNFAIVGNETRYHSPGDTIAALDRSSIQHLGSEVLAASRTIGTDRPAGRTVYADIAGRLLVRLPFLVAAVFLGGLVLGAGFLAWRRRALGRPLAAVGAATIAAIAAAFVASWFAGLVRPGDYWRAYPLITYLAVYATAIGAQWSVLAWIGGGVDRSRLRLAAWLSVLVVGGLLALVVPGAMIFFLLAPAIALIGLLVPHPARTVLIWAAALLQLLMFAELAASIEMLLIDGPLWAVAPVAALAALPLLVEGARIPALKAVPPFALLSISLWVAALLAPRASADRPLAFTIDYVRDDQQDKAWWAVASKQAPLPESFRRIANWERGTLPYNGRLRWLADAPMIDVPKASITKVGDLARGGQRRLRFILNPGGADAIAIRFDPNVRIRAMGLAGKPRELDPSADEGPFVLRCSGRACDGLIVDVDLVASSKVDALVIAHRFALPPEGATLQRRRPPNAQPQYGPDSTIRIGAANF